MIHTGVTQAELSPPSMGKQLALGLTTGGKSQVVVVGLGVAHDQAHPREATPMQSYMTKMAKMAKPPALIE